MATRDSIENLRGNTELALGGTLFVVDTNHFGYFNIPKGTEQYLVLEEDGDLSIHKVEAEYNEEGVIAFDVKKAKEVDPIIRVIDGDVFYTSKARQDPYQLHFNEISADAPGETVDKVVDAFKHFVEGNYSTGNAPYITYYEGDQEHETGTVLISVSEEPTEPEDPEVLP